MSQVKSMKKRKSNNTTNDMEPTTSEESSKLFGTQCIKNKKGPLPMKMRALPQSFWQQPNTLAEISPTTYCPPLDEDTEQTSRSEVIGIANTELLFSLFHSVETNGEEEVKLPVVRRGRPLKSKMQVKVTKDVDPYFTSATVPCIQIQDDEKIAQGQQVLAMISVTGEDKSVPVNNSYSEKLSDLVVHL